MISGAGGFDLTSNLRLESRNCGALLGYLPMAEIIIEHGEFFEVWSDDLRFYNEIFFDPQLGESLLESGPDRHWWRLTDPAIQ